MMFATLDDLDGAVELMVFEKTLAAAEAALQLDEIVLVTGRVDHKEAGKVCIIVQDVERFDPSDAEIEKAQGAGRALAAEAAPNAAAAPRRRRAPAADGDRGAARPVRALSRRAEFVLDDAHAHRHRRLRFGDAYRVGRATPAEGGARTASPAWRWPAAA